MRAICPDKVSKFAGPAAGRAVGSDPSILDDSHDSVSDSESCESDSFCRDFKIQKIPAKESKNNTSPTQK